MSNQPSETQIIGAVGNSLFDMALGDIHRSLGCDFPNERLTRQDVLEDGLPLVGVIIQACALIEAAGHHFVGPADTRSGNAFTSFMRKYMTRYNAQDIWQVLRCGLCHEFTPQNNPQPGRALNPVRYVLIKNNDVLHMEPVNGQPDHFYINVQSFIEDVDNAVCAFLTDADNPSSTERASTVGWARNRGVMSVQSFTLPSTGSGMLLLSELASSVVPATDLVITLTQTISADQSPHLAAGRPTRGFLTSRIRSRGGRART